MCRSRVLLFAIVGGLFAFSAAGASGQEKAKTMRDWAGGDKRVSDALQEPATIEFIRTPLRDIVHFLADVHDTHIALDTAAGVSGDVLISANMKGMTLQSALQRTLESHGLAYVVDDNVLLITTPQVAAERQVIRIYRVTHLLPREGNDAENLAEVVRTMVRRPGPEGNVAPTVTSYGGLLIVRDIEAVHGEVAKLLAQIAEGLGVASDRPIKMSAPSGPGNNPFDPDPFSGNVPPNPFRNRAAVPDPFGGSGQLELPPASGPPARRSTPATDDPFGAVPGPDRPRSEDPFDGGIPASDAPGKRSPAGTDDPFGGVRLFPPALDPLGKFAPATADDPIGAAPVPDRPRSEDPFDGETELTEP